MHGRAGGGEGVGKVRGEVQHPSPELVLEAEHDCGRRVAVSQLLHHLLPHLHLIQQRPVSAQICIAKNLTP